MLINIVRIFQRLGDSDRNDDVAVTRNSGLGEIILFAFMIGILRTCICTSYYTCDCTCILINSELQITQSYGRLGTTIQPLNSPMENSITDIFNKIRLTQLPCCKWYILSFTPLAKIYI